MYECEHCKKKVYRNKSSAIRHEKTCFANPVTKACRTCDNYVVDYNTIYSPYHGGEPGSNDYEIKYSYCKFKDGTFEENLKFEHHCPLYKKGTLNF